MALPNDKITTTLVANTLGSNSRDVGTLCTHTAINMWSKWKPVRFSTVVGLTQQELEMVEYGIKAGNNTPSSSYFTPTSPYFIYNKPRGSAYNEPYRLGDFRNYNHDAQCFIKEDTKNRLTFNKIFELQSTYTGGTYGGRLDTTDVLNTGTNVEISADYLNTAITWESYFGLLFYNVTTGQKCYSAYKIKWSELSTRSLNYIDLFPTNVSTSGQYPALTWPEHFYVTADQLNFNNGDEVHVYYCCVPLQFYNSLGQPEQWRTNPQNEQYWEDQFNDNAVIYFMTRGLQDVQVVAPAEKNGHGQISLMKFDFLNNGHLSLYNNLPPNSMIGNQLLVNVDRNASGVVSCGLVKLPLSVYYYNYIPASELVNPKITIDFEVKANGVVLLSETVARTCYSTMREVSTSVNHANLAVVTTSAATKNTTNISTSETATITFTMKARGATTSPSRTIVSGTCTISTGGVKSWHFNQH